MKNRGRIYLKKETESRAEDCFFLNSLVFVFGFRKMGRYLTKRMMFLLLTPILLLPLLISSSSSGAPVNPNEKGVSIAKEGRSSPFVSEGKDPKLTDLEFEDVNLCKVLHGKTCSSALKAVENLATYGEVVNDCQSGTIRICASFCDSRVFEACSDAYFSGDASDQVIVPCGASKSIICRKASKWESNGTAFCYAVGFTVEEEPYYGSKSCLEEPPFVVEEQPLIKTEYSAWFHWLQVSWLVTVLVLRTMLLKRWRDQQQMRAMIHRMREER